MKIFTAFLLLLLNFNTGTSPDNPLAIQPPEFLLGNEALLTQHKEFLTGKKIGIITNNSGVLSDGTSVVDAMHSAGMNVVKVFSPEHGFRGDDSDYDHTDAVTGVQVVSIYGKKNKPSSNDLGDIDVVVYDIQDVGARFYTYTSTLLYCMEAAADNGKKFVVCDRPVIGSPSYVDGFILENDVKSFVGSLNIPIAYGMTCGELARYINGEVLNNRCDLEVISMKGYSRETDYNTLNLTWVKPSPSMYFPSTAVTYSGTCLLEGTNFSEGRGTDKPFEYVGAPYCSGQQLKDEMDSYNFQGVKFEAIEFTPGTIASQSNPPKFVGERCEGIYINVTDKKSFEPVKVGLALLISLDKLFPSFKIRNDNFIDKLSGTKSLRKSISNKENLESIENYYLQDLENFKTTRVKYLIY